MVDTHRLLANSSYEEVPSLGKMISTIGWTIEEFVDATRDYVEYRINNYDWYHVMSNLWASTHHRIQYWCRQAHKFSYSNDWRSVMEYSLNLEKLRLLYSAKTKDGRSITQLEALLKVQNPHSYPRDHKEKLAIYKITNAATQLFNYTKDYPASTLTELMNMREYVDRQHNRRHMRN